MTEQPVDTSTAESGGTPSTAPPALKRQVRRTMLATGFSDVPGKACATCGFLGFRWQSTCPQGHPLA